MSEKDFAKLINILTDIKAEQNVKFSKLENRFDNLETKVEEMDTNINYLLREDHDIKYIISQIIIPKIGEIDGKINKLIEDKDEEKNKENKKIHIL